MYESYNFSSFEMRHTANERIILLYGILQYEHIAFAYSQNGQNHACKSCEESENSVLKVCLRQSNVLEPHALKYLFVVIF